MPPNAHSLTSPTLWLTTSLLLVFIYLQWPTREPLQEVITHTTQMGPRNVQLSWEAKPTAIEEESIWGLSHQGMEFLAQRNANQGIGLEAITRQQLAVDLAQVNGRVYQAIEMTETGYTYALYDVENRIQRHQIYALGEDWLKLSVLYQANQEKQVSRANYFFNSMRDLCTEDDVTFSQAKIGDKKC